MSAIKRMAVVAYTEYSRDARVRKATETACQSGFEVDCFLLKDIHPSERVEGLNIIQTQVKQYRGESNLAYIKSYLYFFFIVFLKLSQLSFKRKYHIVHIHNMPDFLVFTSIISKIRGAKIILDIHDSMVLVYPYKFSSKWMNLFTNLFQFFWLIYPIGNDPNTLNLEEENMEGFLVFLI